MKTSVALCTYNGEKYLEEQIDSILSQSQTVDEIIICDDKSTDSTYEIIKNYKKKYPNLFSIYQNEKNLGYVSNFEKALALAKHDVVFLCDQDDIWYPEKVEKIINVFHHKPQVHLITHNVQLFGEDIKDDIISYWELEKFDPNLYKKNSEIILKLLFEGNVFPGMSMTIRKSFLVINIPLKKVLNFVIHDYELLLVAADTDSLYIEKEFLGKYRIHDKQNIGFKKFLSASESDEKLIQSDFIKHYQRHRIVKLLVEKLYLELKWIDIHKKYCLERYNEYYKNLSFSEKIITSLKYRFYYKINDYLQ